MIVTNGDGKKAPHIKTVTSNTAFSLSLQKHSFFKFIIVLDGTLTLTVNGKAKEIKRGRVQLLRPEEEYSLFARKHVHCEVSVFPNAMQAICECIHPDLYSELLEASLPVDFTVFDFDLKHLENRLNFFSAPDNQDENTLRAAHIAVVSELIHLWQQARIHTPSSLPAWLNELLRQLSTEEFLTMSVGDIIASTHYSHGHVCREFKKFFGVSLHDYLTDQKFSYGKSLLYSGTKTIAEIAELLNYDSTSNFVIAFKKRFGVSPTQWRKNQA
jgi:AraC-like DNA-binding protein